MAESPQVKPGDWIAIGSIDAVVTEVRGLEAEGHLEVVCNPDKPALYRVNWNGEHWEFAHPMRGDYAEHVPRTLPYVDTLTRGRRNQ
jgi:hypothetical protein